MVQHLFFSQDLQRWTFLGPFVQNDDFTEPGEDGAVPFFWPIGDRHILVFASHQRGSQYLLGDYDSVHHSARPLQLRTDRGPRGVHPPSATPDSSGGVYVIHNINEGKPTEGWNHIMSLFRRLTLSEDGAVGIEPVATVEPLRQQGKQVSETTLPANEEAVLAGVQGKAMELAVEIDPQNARDVGIHVLRSPDYREYTAVRFYRHGHLRMNTERPDQMDAITIDSSRSPILPNVLARAPETAPFALGENEVLKLRIFVDRSVVEVFANGRQCLALRVYPDREDSVGASLCGPREATPSCARWKHGRCGTSGLTGEPHRYLT